jgi:spermidine synthase
MGGLALGNHLLGKQADRVRNRLKFYGWLEIGVGLYCALSLQIINWGSELYVSLARASFPPGPLVHLLRLFLAGVALLVPTVLMGGTLPVLARLWVRSIRATAQGVATLYSVNSFGAVLGSLAAGFFLIRYLGISLSMLAAASVNILVGLLAIFLHRFTGKEADPREGEAPSLQGSGSVRIIRLALLGAALQETEKAFL